MSPPRKDGRRRLTADERALWSSITRSVVPLARRPSMESATGEETPSAPPERAGPTKPQHAPAAAAAPANPPPLVPLDRRTRQRLARSRAKVEARIDLHGMTQAQAFPALRRFLRAAQADGARIVLVITGKGGRAGDPFDERGVLRRQVPLWLESKDLRPLVVGFEPAHIGHGGEGALYVRIRRAR